ncbi:hypothetical protein ASG56_05875 [Rhodococcus sp. Leaf7]|uniref:hypothetical protein n=1 Tax=unclassified Rhodococcus (in: high G+C Gram-positive bacteria) TaxID=192944 RepID=UPI0005ACA973|nr:MULTISPECIES: hypothetical protein [unclassified Rhodococcus (in: high G+C Gram-positive bacteria)]KIQ17450.1 hypothetical protein RU01_09645 [Rhodococcus sp. MEB064]KQU07079.1 hypothetical protein ASG56_05875 [Rhodococcus sp. Leaf7]KQU42597.1 hypothetical protein ASG64_05875 [Rhodococcus sp. Leaf247]
MSIDPRIKMTAGIIMAAISYVVAVTNFIDGDVRSGLILTLIGIFFSTVLVQTIGRFVADKSR